jgi:hypothetical protein
MQNANAKAHGMHASHGRNAECRMQRLTESTQDHGRNAECRMQNAKAHGKHARARKKCRMQNAKSKRQMLADVSAEFYLWGFILAAWDSYGHFIVSIRTGQ